MSSKNKISLYPIFSVSASWEDEPFDASRLPASIVPQAAIEDVTAMLRDKDFEKFGDALSKRDLDALHSVKYAIVHRYSGVDLEEHQTKLASRKLVAELAACLRLIRPMRQSALMVQGALSEDGTLDIETMDLPAHLMEVPHIQKGFSLRNRDVEELRRVAAKFVTAMNGDWWKIRMPVSLHEPAHFEDRTWTRLMLLSSAIEAIFTSQTKDHEHSGSRLASERIKWFLGGTTSIYAPGDVPSFAPNDGPTIGEILADLYEVRNCISHGEKVPDRFSTPSTASVGSINRIEILEEAASFIVRYSILKILKEDLLEHFRGGLESQRYFSSHGLTNSALARASKSAVKPVTS